MEPTREYVESYLRRADESLQAAIVLLQNNLFRDVVSRAYYAMFHAAQAALATQNVKMPKRHSGVISLFGEKFVKTGRLEKKFADNLSRAFRLRQMADYEISVEFEKSSVEELIKNAEGFIQSIKTLLHSL